MSRHAATARPVVAGDAGELEHQDALALRAAASAMPAFTVRVRDGGPQDIGGTTFFEARAAFAVENGVEPGDVRLDPPRRYEP